MSIHSHSEKTCCSIKDSIKTFSKSKEFEKGFLTPNDTIDLGSTISGTSKDIWDVAKLPADLKPISKPSRRLEKFLRDKESNHYGAVEKMKDELRKVNFDFEESYRYNAELLKIFLQKQKGNAEDVVEETLFEPKNTIIFGALKYNDIPAAICNYNNCCREAIEKFYNCTLFLEKQRCDNYKKIFKSSYLEVCEISHLLPFQIQLFFELEINKFNEILLQNYRCYAEVDMILKSDVEQNKIMWHQKFNRNKAKWMDFFKSQGLSTNELQKISEIDVTNMMSLVKITFTNKYKEILATVTELDEQVDGALRKCKFVLLKIYYGEYNELHTLDDSFLVPTDNASRDQVLHFQNELKDMIQKDEAEHLLENELDDTYFNIGIEALRDRIKKTDIFLTTVSKLWKAHYQREVELTEIVAQHIKKIMELHDAIQGVEMQLSIYNDACRSAATMEEMQLNFGYSIATLKKCGDMYKDQMTKEQTILTKYLEMVGVETDILVAEINRFLVVYEPSYDHPLPRQTRQSTEELLTDEKMVPTSTEAIKCERSKTEVKNPSYIKYINFRITSLDNWKYGIWETIETKMRECKEEKLVKAKAWTVPYKNAIDLRYQQKLAINNIKFYRTWLTVYYMRYMEIQQHHDRLEKHKKGITEVIEDLIECQIKMSTEISLLVDVNAKGISDLEEEVKNAKSKTYLQSANTKMTTLKKTFQTNLDELAKNYAAEKLNYELIVKRSNIEYLKNVSMFSESGNFHADEVKVLIEALQKAEKDFLNKTEKDEKDFLVAQVPKLSQKIGGLEMSFKNRSNHMQDEFDFLNNIHDCMSTLQIDIKKLAYNLKYKRKVVHAYLEKLKELAINLTGKTAQNTLENFAAQCFQVIKHFQELYLVLKRNDECDLMPNITKSMADPTDNRPKSGTDLKSTSKILQTENETPFNDDVVNLLREKMEQMRNFGLSFYTTVTSIINKDKIEETFEEFCGNIMAQCAYFQIQCDAMWLEEAIEYVNLSTVFRNGLLQTYKNFSNICQEFNQLQYENRFANLLEMLNNVQMDAVIDIKTTHQKLKTLHGCPKNKPLLETLQNEFAKQLEGYDSRIDESIGNFKEEHEDLKDFIIDKLAIFDDILRELLSSERLKNLNGDMFVQILNLFSKLQIVTKKSSIALSSDQNTIISKIANEKFSIYKSSLIVIPIPEEYVARFSVSNASFRIESTSDTFSFDDNALDGADLAAFSKKMEYILNKHLEGIDRYRTSVRFDCENWQAIWENDVRIIKNLYTVKYAAPQNIPDSK